MGKMLRTPWMQSTNLVAWVESKESEWWADLLDPDQSVMEAIRISESSTKPVVIADSQDNPEPEEFQHHRHASCPVKA